MKDPIFPPEASMMLYFKSAGSYSMPKKYCETRPEGVRTMSALACAHWRIASS